MDERLYKALLGASILAFFIIRAPHVRRVQQAEKVAQKSPLRERLLVALNFAGMMVLPCVYVFTDWFEVFKMDLPAAVRVIGAVVYGVSLVLMMWVLRTLAGNWSMTLEISRGHQMITAGPFHLVRHPMYTAFCLMVLGQWLLSSNWLVGVFGVVAWGILYRIRVRPEEDLMVEQFGDAYRDYMERTGRLLPKMRRGSRG